MSCDFVIHIVDNDAAILDALRLLLAGLFSPLIFWWLWDSFRRECVNLSATARIGGCRHANAAAGDFTRNSGSSSR